MDVLNLTKITIAWEMFESGIPKTHIASRLEINRETVHIWIKEISEVGLLEYLDQYTQAKKGERSNGITLSTTTIYKVLGEKFQLRSKWKKNQLRGPISEAISPREVIQMDTVDFGGIFAFTGVDIFSKEVNVKLYPSLTAKDGLDFLSSSFDSKFHHTNLLQTDGGPEFKAEFRSNVFKYADRFRVSRPYKKNEQSYIESFNRTVRKECLGWSKYRVDQLPSLLI